MIKAEITLCAGLFPPKQGENLDIAIETLSSKIRILWIHEENLVPWDLWNPHLSPNNTTKGITTRPGSGCLGSLPLKCLTGAKRGIFFFFAPSVGEFRETKKQNDFFLTLTLWKRMIKCLLSYHCPITEQRPSSFPSLMGQSYFRSISSWTWA